jgi:hypothetical protein
MARPGSLKAVSFMVLVAMFSVMAAAYDPTGNDNLDVLLTSRKLLEDGGMIIHCFHSLPV